MFLLHKPRRLFPQSNVFRVYPIKYAHGYCALFLHDCIIISLWIHVVKLPYPSGLLHWHWGNHMIAPVPLKQP